MRDIPIYLSAVLFGVTTAVLELKLGDLLVTAFAVLLFSMILGVARPDRLWRWILLVPIFIPILRMVAYFALGQKPYLAQMWEPGFAFVIAAVGAYCGMFARKAVENLFAQGGKTGA